MACDTLNMFDVGGVVYRENFYYHYFCAGMHCIDGGCSGSAGKRRRTGRDRWYRRYLLEQE